MNIGVFHIMSVGIARLCYPFPAKEATIDTSTKQIAFGDESVRMVGEPPFYLLGATLVTLESRSRLIDIANLRPPGAAKLHWRDMGYKLQRQSLGIIADLGFRSLVAIARPLDGRRQERARRKCLERMLTRLGAEGIDELLLESRGESLDSRDLDFVKHARASRRIGPCAVNHIEAAGNPALWIPDQVVGAMGDTLTHVGNWRRWQREWARVKRHVEIIDVPLSR